ncbi:MAG: BatD family protein [Methylococcus sp.]|nr:BatD family protein [Methylococcus sp.]
MAKHCKRAWSLVILGLLLWLSLSGAGLAAEITVSADRDPVPLNESFNLTFSADESPDDEPDFGPLNQDFRVLGQSQNSQMSIVNGKVSHTLEWTVSVIAKHAGKLTVPPIAFGADRSKPAAITVTDKAAQGQTRGGGDDMLLIEVDAAPKNPYVQAQVIYTLRVLYRTDLGRAQLSPLEVPDALVQQLGDKRNFSTERNGYTYTATELTYAIFPQKSGTLRIAPVSLDAEIQAGGRGRMNPFFGRPTKTVSLRSKAMELQVRPVPPAFSGQHWLPAENLTLEDAWSPDTAKIEAGQPLTRTITLQARGATVGVLPELGLQGLPAAIRRYPDQPAMDEQRQGGGIVSTRREKTALIPDKPGLYTLPAIEVPWWNVAADKMEVARLPERTIEVGGGAAVPIQPAPSPETLAAPETESAAQTFTPPTPTEPNFTGSPVWFWLSIVLAGGWLATGGLWWRSAQRPTIAPAEKRPEPETGKPSDKRCMRELKEACAANDPERTRRALLAWAALRWPDGEASLEAIVARSEGELKTAVQALGKTLYGHPREAWKGAVLWAAVVTTDLGKSRQENRNAAEIASLHP